MDRLEAAEEVCWTLSLMMMFGMLEIPLENREFLYKSYEKWITLAVRDGLMKGDSRPKGLMRFAR